MGLAVAESIAIHADTMQHQRAGVCVPEQRTSERLIALGLLLLTFVYLCLFRQYSFIDPDEGIILQGAQRILDGQVLYRDFFSFFTPGSYYLVALTFRIFGDSLLVAHTLLAAIAAAFSPITYVLCRRVCSRQASLLVTVLMAVTALPLRFVVAHNWESTLLACIGLFCAVRFLESRGRVWAFSAASFVSLTAMFEQSKGAGLLLGVVLGFLLINKLGDSQERLLTRPTLIAIVVGLCWPTAITLAYFASQHALLDTLAAWFWPLQHYSGANRVPYGYSNLTEEGRQALFGTGAWSERLLKIMVFSPPLWLPILPLFGTALLPRLVLGKLRRRTLDADWAYYVLISATISGLLVSMLVVRLDYPHFVYLHPIFLIVLAWLIDGRGIRSRAFARMAPLLGFCLAVSLLTMGTALLVRTRANNHLITRRGPITTQLRDDLAPYIERHVPAGEQILIYPYQPTYYFLTRTNNPTRYEYYQAGMHTSAQLENMLSDLRAHPVRVVLYDPSFADHIRVSWPNTPPSALASDAVADYIAREYRMCKWLDSAASLGSPEHFRFLFMIRKDLPCP